MPKICIFVIISDYYRPFVFSWQLGACVIWLPSPVSSGPTPTLLNFYPTTVIIGRALWEAHYLKKEEYMKDICNAKLKNFSCCFLYCSFSGQAHVLSSTESRVWDIFQIFLNKIFVLHISFFDSKY